MLDRTQTVSWERQAPNKPILPQLATAEPENGQDSLSSFRKAELTVICQDRYQPDSCLTKILESTGQTEAAQLSQRAAHPGSRIKATVSANKTLTPARRASRGGERACSCRKPHQMQHSARQSARGSGPCFIAFILITQSLNKIKVLIPSSSSGSCCALGFSWCHEASQAVTAEGTSLTASHGSISRIRVAP